jgi:DivIVA domain-containing protein
MDSSQPARSSLEMLRTVEFRQSLKGYNVEEVDEYLEKAAVEAESLQEQARQVNERLRQATERITQLEAELRESPPSAVPAAVPVEGAQADESLQRTLLMAQRFVDQARRESEAEAAEVVAQAELRAQTTIAQAEERARRLATDAEQQLRDEVSRLESSRGQLAVDVENMARHLDLERTRLQGALTEILQWIDDNIQPGRSLLALRGSGLPQAEDDPAPPRFEAAAPASDETSLLDLHHAAPSASSAPGGAPTVEGR